MLIKKNQTVKVVDGRKGTYLGLSTKDFDTEKDEWYSIIVAPGECVQGIDTTWHPGDSIPARRGLCVVTPI